MQRSDFKGRAKVRTKKHDDSLPKTRGTKTRIEMYIRKYPEWYKLSWLEEGELPGSIQPQYVRCGKENCKCSSGRREDRHVVYYRFWTEDGKRRKQYVSRQNLRSTIEQIERRRERLKRQRSSRNTHMRRGMGNGKPAHIWRKLNAS